MTEIPELKDILPDKHSTILKKIRKSVAFSKALIWLIIQFQKEKVPEVGSRDLSKVLNCDVSYANKILTQFADLGLIKCHRAVGIIYWTPVFNEKRLLLLDYLETAKKTLGVK